MQKTNHQRLTQTEFVLVPLTFQTEGEHRPASRLVKLLGVSLQMNLDKIDVVTRTGLRGMRVLKLRQSYLAGYIRWVKAAGVYNVPEVIPAVNDLL
jgi:hypothetical protein